MTQRKRTFLAIFVTASAFLTVSLVNDRMWPHRFALGIPFILAIVCVAVGVTELQSDELRRRLYSRMTASASASLWLCATTLVWNLSALFIESPANRAGIVLLSTIMCLLTGLSLTISCYQWLHEGPAFQPPGPKRSDSKVSASPAAGKPTQMNSFGLITCLMAAFAILQLGTALQRIAASQQYSWATPFFISELGSGRRAAEFSMVLTGYGLLTFAFFLNFLTHHQPYASASVRITVTGSAAVAGIIGVGLWDLRSPLHYVFVALWSIAAVLAAGSPVPTVRGLLPLIVCKWMVRLSFLTYGALMIWLLWFPELRLPAIVAQRVAIVALLLWFARVWLIVFADSLLWRNRPGLETE